MVASDRRDTDSLDVAKMMRGAIVPVLLMTSMWRYASSSARRSSFIDQGIERYLRPIGFFSRS